MAQEIWFRNDIANLLASLDSVPVPDGEYANGWRDALAALGVAIGVEAQRGPRVRIVPNGRMIGAPNGAVTVYGR
jgi:hypothetical protein